MRQNDICQFNTCLKSNFQSWTVEWIGFCFQKIAEQFFCLAYRDGNRFNQFSLFSCNKRTFYFDWIPKAKTKRNQNVRFCFACLSMSSQNLSPNGIVDSSISLVHSMKVSDVSKCFVWKSMNWIRRRNVCLSLR